MGVHKTCPEFDEASHKVGGFDDHAKKGKVWEDAALKIETKIASGDVHGLDKLELELDVAECHKLAMHEYKAAGLKDKAADEEEKWLTKTEGVGGSHLGHALSLKAQGKDDEAADELLEGFALATIRADLHLVRASELKAKGDLEGWARELEEARSAFERILGWLDVSYQQKFEKLYKKLRAQYDSIKADAEKAKQKVDEQKKTTEERKPAETGGGESEPLLDGATVLATYSYVNDDGDTITVSSLADGTQRSACTNGTITELYPDGSSRSVNDPFDGPALVVEVFEDGTRVTYFPDGTIEAVYTDGTTTWVSEEHHAVHTLADGTVVVGSWQGFEEFDVRDVEHIRELGEQTGLTYEQAVITEAIGEVTVVSTGHNTGTVAVIEFVSDGTVPYIYLAPSMLVPDDTETNQVLNLAPLVIDTSEAGRLSVEVVGLCRQHPYKPPADAGDTAVRIQIMEIDDITWTVEHIVEGVVASGIVEIDLGAIDIDLVTTLTQITTWLLTGSSTEEVVGFLEEHMPSYTSEEERRRCSTELTHWGSRLVDKTRNLDKQRIVEVGEVPPEFIGETL